MGWVLACFLSLPWRSQSAFLYMDVLTHLDMSIKGTSTGTYFIQYQNKGVCVTWAVPLGGNHNILDGLSAPSGTQGLSHAQLSKLITLFSLLTHFTFCSGLFPFMTWRRLLVHERHLTHIPLPECGMQCFLTCPIHHPEEGGGHKIQTSLKSCSCRRGNSNTPFSRTWMQTDYREEPRQKLIFLI